jgi:hypothetical protein
LWMRWLSVSAGETIVPALYGGLLALPGSVTSTGPTPCCHCRGAMLTGSHAFTGRLLAFAGYCYDCAALRPLRDTVTNTGPTPCYLYRETRSMYRAPLFGGGPLAFIGYCDIYGAYAALPLPKDALNVSRAFAGRTPAETACAPERPTVNRLWRRYRARRNITGAHSETAKAGVTGKGTGTPAPFPVTGPASFVPCAPVPATGAVSS